MKAGYYPITLQRGGAYSELLSFVRSTDYEEGIITPIDLTGLNPFTAQIRDKSLGPRVLEITVSNTDLSNGKITLSATAEQTENLRPHIASWGLIDKDGFLYVCGPATIEPMIPEL